MSAFLSSDELRALDLSRDLPLDAKSLVRVGQQTTPELARWAFEQWDLRRRGSSKFARSLEMLFVREALEQATHEGLASYHASCFPAGVPVVDLTVGIGADLIALAQRGPARGFEFDHERARAARHNLAVHGLDAEVIAEDAMLGEWGPFVFADPARRVGGRRSLDLDQFSPNPRELASRLAGCQLAGIKLSPMLRDEELAELGPCVEFVSFGGECREAIVWCGELASKKAGRWAVHVESGLRLEGEPSNPAGVSTPKTFLAEADPAAIRAHALGSLYENYGLISLSNTPGYLYSNEIIQTPWIAQWFEVLEVLKFDLKQIRAALRRHQLELESIKSRGVSFDMTRVRKELGVVGTGDIVLIVFSTWGGVEAAITRRVSA